MFWLMGTFGGIRDLKHDPKLAEALGHMVVVWSNVDQALVNLLHKMTTCSRPMASAAYYRIPTFESRIKVLLAVLREWKTETYDKEAIGRAVAKLSRLSKTRNGWVHGTWVKRNLTNHTFIFDYRAEAGGPNRRKPIKASDVTNHVEAVQRQVMNLLEYCPSSAAPPPRPPESSLDP
jgi:hypothetical protein